MVYAGSGDDIISSTGQDYSNSETVYGSDACAGEGGYDIVYCSRAETSTCNGGAGGNDICSMDCGTSGPQVPQNPYCEVTDPYVSLGCSPEDPDCADDLRD